MCVRFFMEHLMDPMAAMFKAPGNPDLTPDLKRTIVKEYCRRPQDRSAEQLTEEE